MVDNVNFVIDTPLGYTHNRSVYHADTCAPLSKAVQSGLIDLQSLARGHYPGARLPDSQLSEISTLGRWDATAKQNWGLDWHRNEGIELTLLTHGQVGFAVDEAQFELQPGQMTVTRPWQRHRVGSPNIGASRLHWIIIDVAVRRPNQEWQWPDWLVMSPIELAQLTNFLQHNEAPVWMATEDIIENFTQLTDLAGRPNRSSLVTRLKISINSLLADILEMLRSEAPTLDTNLSSTRRTVQLFLEKLPEQASERWRVEDMAEACGLHRSRFAYYCQQLTNSTPIGYLMSLRIEKAKSLLAHGRDCSLTEIGAECGFETSQYFSARFKNATGKTPSEFRRDYRTTFP